MPLDLALPDILGCLMPKSLVSLRVGPCPRVLRTLPTDKGPTCASYLLDGPKRTTRPPEPGHRLLCKASWRSLGSDPICSIAGGFVMREEDITKLAEAPWTEEGLNPVTRRYPDDDRSRRRALDGRGSRLPQPHHPSRAPDLSVHHVQCTTFELDEHSYRDIVEGDGFEEIWYTRFGNPTVAWAADTVARLEGGQAAVMASSGMGAIATTLLSLCRAGDRIVAGRELYGDTRDLLVRDLPSLGIGVDFVATTDLAEWEAALAAGPAAVAYAESLSNPQLRVLDIPRVAELAHRRGARMVVDNTFASAFAVQPLRLGADVVVHSATKFLNGHSDVVAGAVVSDGVSLREVQRRVVTFGTCLDPHAAFLVARALHTYELRLRRQGEAAASIARWLEDSPEVFEVSYPGLASHPDAAVAERTWRPGRRGAMVAFVVRGGNERAARFLRALNLVREATSLGGVETLISAPHNSSHFSYTPQELNLAGIKPGLVRLSVGIEDAAELHADLDQALQRTAPPSPAQRT
jgi:cystathionine beta-lyase/cystathionine gamma-synthase